MHTAKAKDLRFGLAEGREGGEKEAGGKESTKKPRPIITSHLTLVPAVGIAVLSSQTSLGLARFFSRSLSRKDELHQNRVVRTRFEAWRITSTACSMRTL